MKGWLLELRFMIFELPIKREPRRQEPRIKTGWKLENQQPTTKLQFNLLYRFINIFVNWQYIF